MPEIQTRLEQLKELRNTVSRRKVEGEAGVLYWQRMSKKEKANTQGKVDAEQSIALQQQNVKKDKIYLECIDELIEKEKHATSAA